MAILYLAIAFLLVALDQVFKYFVLLHLKPIHSAIAIPHILDLVYVENRGVAFGMFKDLRWLFVVITGVVIIAFVFLLIKNAKTSKLFSVSATLIIGGGIGNLIDRIVHGYVIDYLRLSFFPPVCNFADYCITAGTVLLVIYLLFYSDLGNDNKIKESKNCDE